MQASNKFANYIFLLLGLVAFYFLYVYVPIYWDNIELRQAARVWISSSRREGDEPKTAQEFKSNVRSIGLNLPEGSCTYTRTNDEMGAVACDYVRTVEFPLTGKTRPLRFKWTVNQKFRI